MHGSFHAAWCWQVLPSDQSPVQRLLYHGHILLYWLQKSAERASIILLTELHPEGSDQGGHVLQEHFLAYFAAAGYDSYAVSLRGQGQSQKLPDMKACSLAQHAADLGWIVGSLPRTPVLIGHSFGGLVVQRSGPRQLQHALCFINSVQCIACKLGTADSIPPDEIEAGMLPNAGMSRGLEAKQSLSGCLL